MAAGAVFVFVLSIGNFITPDLLGGGKLQMVGNLIYDQFLTARDWPFGATLSGMLIALMMIAAVPAGRWRPAGPGAIMPRALNTHLGATYAFLYVPIAVLMVLSFNRAGLPTAWTGFSIEWYGRLAANPKIIASAWNSLVVAFGLDRHRHRAWHAAGARRRTRASPRPRAMRCCSRR